MVQSRRWSSGLSCCIQSAHAHKQVDIAKMPGADGSVGIELEMANGRERLSRGRLIVAELEQWPKTFANRPGLARLADAPFFDANWVRRHAHERSLRLPAIRKVKAKRRRPELTKICAAELL